MPSFRLPWSAGSPNRATTLNMQGPSVVWIRLGNASRRETLRWFAAVFPDVIVALTRGDTLVEIT